MQGVVPFKKNFTGSRLVQAQDSPPRCRFSAARFAYKTKRFALVYGKTYIIYSMKETFFCRKVFF